MQTNNGELFREIINGCVVRAWPSTNDVNVYGPEGQHLYHSCLRDGTALADAMRVAQDFIPTPPTFTGDPRQWPVGQYESDGRHHVAVARDYDTKVALYWSSSYLSPQTTTLLAGKYTRKENA